MADIEMGGQAPSVAGAKRKESVDILEKECQKSGIIGTTLNFINTVLGSGILGIPAALYHTGLGFGLFLLAFVSWVSDYLTRKTIELARKEKQKSFEDLCEHAFGKLGFYAISLSCATLLFSAISAYSVIVYQNIPLVVNQYINGAVPSVMTDTYCETVKWTVIIGTVAIHVFVIYPLCLLKDLSRLQFTSALSVVTFGVIFVIALLQADDGVTAFKTYAAAKYLVLSNAGDTAGAAAAAWVDPKVSFFNTDWSFFNGLGTFAFALVCTDCIFDIFDSLKDGTSRRWARITHLSVGFLAILYTAFSVYPFIKFGKQAYGNILCSYPRDDTLVNVARVALGITIVLTYPMANFCMRTYVFAMLRPIVGDRVNIDSTVFWVAFTTLTVLTTLTVGLTVGHLGIVMSLGGLVSATMCGFVIPALIIFKLNGFRNMLAKANDSTQTFSKRLSAWMNIILPAIIIIFGLVCFFIGAPTTLIVTSTQPPRRRRVIGFRVVSPQLNKP
eukprot:673835_1